MTFVPLVVGVSYKSAPVEVRERLFVADAEIPAVLGVLEGLTQQAALLATCSRMELYAIGTSPRDLRHLSRVFGSWRNVTERELSPFTYGLAAEEAVRHLFRTTAGLDSMVLGETQVLGQVGDALRDAERAGHSGRELGHLFTSAIRAGRRVRRETGIARNGASIPSVAVELARRVLGRLADRDALVIGAGKIGMLSARVFLNTGVKEITVINRSPERSQEIASSLGGKALPFSALEETLARVDVVVSGTGAKDPIITTEMVQHAMVRREGRPLLLVDIAVPRDIEPSAGDVAGVYLYNVDDLTEIAQQNMRQREAEVEHVERILAEEMRKFRDWWRSQTVQPTIRAIQQEAEAVRQRELSEALQKLSHLSDEEKETVEALSHALMKKLLHNPFLSLRNSPEDEAHIAIARRLFGLPPESDHV